MCWCFFLLFFCTISFSRFKVVHRFNINANNTKVLSRQTIALWNSYALLFTHGSHFQRFCSLSLVLDMHFSSFKRFFLIQLHLFLFFVGTLFGLFIFICEKKKLLRFWHLNFFCFSFCMKSVVAVVTNHKKCVYTRKIEIYRKLIAI